MATTEVFMSNRQYTDEFKAEAVKQVTERGFRVADVAQRLGVSTHSLYEWLRKAKRALPMPTARRRHCCRRRRTRRRSGD